MQVKQEVRYLVESEGLYLKDLQRALDGLSGAWTPRPWEALDMTPDRANLALKELGESLYCSWAQRVEINDENFPDPE